jgi:mono/diheme cytochrome c family protein
MCDPLVSTGFTRFHIRHVRIFWTVLHSLSPDSVKCFAALERTVSPEELMSPLLQKLTLRVLLLGLALAVLMGWIKPNTTAADKAEVERGRYLVEEVAKCAECHTPRNAKGELEQNAWLQGAQIWIMPIRPIPNWAERAPALAGLPSLTDVQAEQVLEKGVGPEGEILRPPMHIYHISHADARAIIAYLKSLPASLP